MLGLHVIFFSVLGTSLALDLTGCRGRPKVINALLQLKGDIYSPGYEENELYPNDLYCQYTFQAPYGFRFRIKFVDLDIEPFDLCDRDALEIYEGVSPRSPVHGVFCGNSTYPDIITLGNAVHIVFRTDFMLGRKGFHLQYHASSIQNLCKAGEKACRNRKCFSPTQTCDGNDDCGDGTDEENCGLPLVSTTCGVRPKASFFDEGADRIVGGKEATPGSWPWQADLQLFFYHPNGHMCGGTLINAQWVISAAHCFMQNPNPLEWRLHLGNHHKFVKDDDEQVRFVERIIIYPDVTDQKLMDFQLEDLTHDIALMKLNAPVQFTDAVKPACLPKQGFQLKPGTKCMATGWGTTRGSGSAHVLKEVEMWIETPETCEGEFGPINNKTMICVSNRHGLQDVCHGDSGGPLVCEFDGKWHVLGATSHGTAGNMQGGLCGMVGSYTVYSNVADKIEWIEKNIDKYS
ncbi:plasma kallikrein [Trichonephila clavata]|uniref:Plasma kallikrein n=1 Tax=Trichonephila clavata TaxID=2740835 RepID=A0A8X6F2U8_TRICU|nr:plasma kallikrein [Trichonephila clavata]